MVSLNGHLFRQQLQRSGTFERDHHCVTAGIGCPTFGHEVEGFLTTLPTSEDIHHWRRDFVRKVDGRHSDTKVYLEHSLCQPVQLIKPARWLRGSKARVFVDGNAAFGAG